MQLQGNFVDVMLKQTLEVATTLGQHCQKEKMKIPTQSVNIHVNVRGPVKIFHNSNCQQYHWHNIYSKLSQMVLITLNVHIIF